MPTSRYQDKVLETYARSLMEAAKAENHVFEDLEMIERLADELRAENPPKKKK